MSTLIILWPLRLLYLERRFYHLNHPRIVHLRNVKDVAPSKRLNSKALIYLFYLLWASFITFGIRALDSRVSLIQTSHRGIFVITFFLWRFRSCKKYPFEKTWRWTLGPNFRAFCRIFSEIWSEEVGLFADSWITLKTGDLGKIVITFFLSIRLKFRKTLQKEDEL